MVGGNKRIKNNVVPHKFIDEPNPINIDDARSMEVHQQGFEKLDLSIDNLTLDQNSSSTMDNVNLEVIESLNCIAEEHSNNNIFNNMNINDHQGSEMIPPFNNVCHDYLATGNEKINVAVQVKIRSSCRSTKVQCKPQTKDRATSPIELSFENKNLHNSCSLPTNNRQLTNLSPNISNLSPNTTNLSPHTTVSSYPTSSSDNFLSTHASTENEWKSAFQQEEFQKCNLKQTFERIRLSPRKYIGIPSDCMDLIDILRTANLTDVDVFITLKKNTIK